MGAWRARVRVKVKRKRRRMAAPSFQVMGEKSPGTGGFGACCDDGVVGFEGLRFDCCGGGVVVGCAGCEEAECEWRGVGAVAGFACAGYAGGGGGRGFHSPCDV